jgi:RNA polymerase sigma-54 factor
MDRFQPRLGLDLRVAQKQILTPGLVQMVKILALNKLELREMINQEIVANPVLEEVPEESPSLDEVAQKLEATAPQPGADDNGNGADSSADSFEEIDFGSFFRDYLDPGYRAPASEVYEQPSPENYLAQPSSLSGHLEWQLSLTECPEEVREAAHSIIGNLNEDGYLSAPLEEVAQAGEHRREDAQQALNLVQAMDPLGVGARNLQECLLIQLRSLAPTNRLAQQIVADHLKQLQSKQYREIARALDRPLEAVERAVELIRKLDPRPGQRYNKTEPRLIEPDVTFAKTSDGFDVRLNDEGLPQLRLSRYYRGLLSDRNATPEVRKQIKVWCASAFQLMKNIEQRKRTIVRVCEVIIRRQREFLEKGMDYLQPMMIKEVAEEVGVHPSTVSRAVAGKYAHTPQGVVELRSFFSEAVQGPAGNSTPLVNLKRLVKKMIEEEDSARPLTDDHIARLLHQQGYNVTRRTVAKYREDMRIPSTHQRRAKS